MNSQKITFSEITDNKGNIGKTIGLSENANKIRKEANTSIWDGVAQRQEMLFSEFPSYIETIARNKCIVLGTSEYENIRIVIKGNEKPPESIARSKDYFSFREQDTLLYFDYDSRGHQDDITPQQFIEIISSTIPSFHNTAKVINYSTSSFLFLNGKQIGGNGFHIYFLIKNADIARFKECLFKRLWIKGFGYILNTPKSQLPKTIFDATVFSPERPVFESKAELKDGLLQKMPSPEYIPGDVLDGSLITDLSQNENVEYSNLVEEEKNKVKDDFESNKTAYIKKEELKLVEKGISKGKAKKAIYNRMKGIILPADFVRFDNGKEVSVDELIKNGESFDRSTLYDPIEPEKGKCKAMFFWNEGSPVISSFVHGGTTYTLTDLNKGNNQRGEELGLAPKYNQKIHSRDKSLIILRSILAEFIENPEHTFISMEAGLGKTHNALEELMELYNSKDSVRADYFSSDHNLSNQSEENISEMESSTGITKKWGLGGITFPAYRTMAGQSKLCDLIISKGLERKKYIVSDDICKNGCFVYRDGPGEGELCKYHRQFQNRMNGVIFYPHASLFAPSSKDKNRKPSFLIIDEDIINTTATHNMIDIV